MNDDIVTMYLSQKDAEDACLESGWYFETDQTDVPQGPYSSRHTAEQAALNYVPQE